VQSATQNLTKIPSAFFKINTRADGHSTARNVTWKNYEPNFSDPFRCLLVQPHPVRAVQFDMVRAPRFHSHGAPCRTITRYTQTWEKSKKHATVIWL